jgi:hypothetical protein
MEVEDLGLRKLWIAAACCRFREGQLAGRALEGRPSSASREQARGEKSGSKLPHSKARA